MGEFLTWLSNNPVVFKILIVTAPLLLIFFIAIASVAIIQGRSVTFWPPQIGEKPSPDKDKPEKKQLSKDLKSGTNVSHPEIAKSTSTASSFECNWTSQHPIASEIKRVRLD